jgi:hypothetical protein
MAVTTLFIKLYKVVSVENLGIRISVFSFPYLYYLPIDLYHQHRPDDDDVSYSI